MGLEPRYESFAELVGTATIMAINRTWTLDDNLKTENIEEEDSENASLEEVSPLLRIACALLLASYLTPTYCR